MAEVFLCNLRWLKCWEITRYREERNDSKQLFSKVAINKSFKWQQILVEVQRKLSQILQPMLLFVRLGITSVRITPTFVPILYDPVKSSGHPMFLSHLCMEERECSFSLKVALQR